MARQRATRQANRGKRRPYSGQYPWWWDYPRIQAQLNPYGLPWRSLREMPLLTDQQSYALMVERLKDQIVGALEASGAFRRA